MAVKKNDRHLARNDYLERCLDVMHQALLLTHQGEYNNKGKRVRKPGKLGSGQAYQVFGSRIIDCAMNAHGQCYNASQIHLRDSRSLTDRTLHHERAIEFYRSILRMLDICIKEYGTSKAKRRSFFYMSGLTNTAIHAIQDRMNRDNLIYQQKYEMKA